MTDLKPLPYILRFREAELNLEKWSDALRAKQGPEIAKRQTPLCRYNRKGRFLHKEANYDQVKSVNSPMG